MADVMVTDEDSSLKALLESASSVLTARQNTSRKHQSKIKKVTGHKKKPIHAMSKEDKGTKKGMPLQIDQLHLDWTEDEDDEDTCNIENIRPVNPRGSENQALKPLHKMISFSSDSDSSPVRKHSLPRVFDQQHQHLTKERTILKDCQEISCSSHIDNTEVFVELDARSTTNVAKGNGAKLKNKRSEANENSVGATENGTRCKGIDLKMKTNNKPPLGREPLGSFRKNNTELHALFDSSESSSESEMASGSVLCLASGAMSDGEDFVELSHKLEQFLSISASLRVPRKQPTKTREDTTTRQGNASPTADSSLGRFRDQHPMSSKGDNTKKCSSSLDPRSSKFHVATDETLSPVGTDGTDVDDVSVSSDTLPEMKDVSVQLSLSSDSRTSPETSIEGSLWKKTAFTQDELIDRQAGSASSSELVFGKDAIIDGSTCTAVTHVEDRSSTNDIGVDVIDKHHEPCTRDLSLQVSLGSTEFSDSESSENDKSLPGKDQTDISKHLPAVQDSNSQVSVTSSNASDSSQVSSESVEDEQLMIIDNNGRSLPPLNSENNSSCQGDITCCDGDDKLKKKLFPRWTAGRLAKKQNVPPSVLWDSGIGATSGKRTDRKQSANRPEGASYIDLCVDDADTQERSLSQEEGSHVTHLEDEDLDDDWLPDLDSSSSEDDLEAFYRDMKTTKVKKPIKDFPSMDVFIVNDSDVSSDDDSALYTTAVCSPPKYNSSIERSVMDGVFVTPNLPPIRRKAKTTVKKSVSSRHHDLGTNRTPLDRVELMTRPHSTSHQRVSEASFLRSLDQQMDSGRRHPEAARYVKDFKKLKEDLTVHLFRLYNKTVFAHKLPEDMSITWNKRLIKTAGFCAYSKRVATPADRKVRIELSVKVCDTAERVRDTLIHELCHAAVWLLNGVNDGHGSHWKYWAHTACRAHPELPAIKRCHKYKISHKYTYKCTKCGYEIGRHSKSLDTKAKVCGYCRSPFVLVTKGTTMPRTPNKFALFVKDNYGSVKRDHKAVTHKDIMRILSSDFARQNSISSSGGEK